MTHGNFYVKKLENGDYFVFEIISTKRYLGEWKNEITYGYYDKDEFIELYKTI